MKKNIAKMLIVTFIFTMMFGMTAYAGGWKKGKYGTWYQNDDGSYPANGWHWVESRKEKGTLWCYYFDNNGYVLQNTTTPDGYTVNNDGEWIVNGVIQSKKAEVKETAATVGSRMADVVVGDLQIRLIKEYDELTGFSKGVMKSNKDDELKYFLFEPKNATDNMPLVVYLHSRGPQVSLPASLLIEDTIEYLMKAGRDTVPAYVLIPYVDYVDRSYYNSHEKIKVLIDAIAKQYKVDQNRISCIGASTGGAGVVVMAHNNPGFFSALVALSSDYDESQDLKDEYVSTVSKTPIWFILEEIGWDYDKMNQSMQKIRDAGGTLWMDVLKGKEHKNMNIFQYGTKDQFGIFNWLVSVSK